MTTTSPRYLQVTDLDPSVAAALLRWALSLADTKHKLGLRTSEWVNSAPALEAAVGASAITQDELGHARALFVVLSQFPDAPAALSTESDLAERTAYFNPRRLDTPWKSWIEVIAANVLIDRALSVVFTATRTSQFAPLKQRAGKILQEEQFHRIFGDSWLARLATDPSRRGELQAALDRFWPTALAWMGPEEDPISRLLYREGILSATPHELRAAWLAEVTPLLMNLDLEIPPDLTEWSTWDSEHREIPDDPPS